MLDVWICGKTRSFVFETLHRSAMVLILFPREAKESEWKTLNSLIILRKKENKIDQYIWQCINKNAIIYLFSYNPYEIFNSNTLVPKLTLKETEKQKV